MGKKKPFRGCQTFIIYIRQTVNFSVEKKIQNTLFCANFSTRKKNKFLCSTWKKKITKEPEAAAAHGEEQVKTPLGRHICVFMSEVQPKKKEKKKKQQQETRGRRGRSSRVWLVGVSTSVWDMREPKRTSTRLRLRLVSNSTQLRTDKHNTHETAQHTQNSTRAGKQTSTCN